MPISLPPSSDLPPQPIRSFDAHRRFLAQLVSGAHLLEAGCGAGEDLHYFRQQGLMITAFDASLAQARDASRLCGQPIKICRFEQMHSVVPFDGIWASASLPCLSEEELAPALAHLASLLKPQAPLYCSFPYGDGQEEAPLAAQPAEYPLRTRLDDIRLAQLIAPLPLSLQQSWYREDDPARPGRWLHALLLRTP